MREVLFIIHIFSVFLSECSWCFIHDGSVIASIAGLSFGLTIRKGQFLYVYEFAPCVHVIKVVFGVNGLYVRSDHDCLLTEDVILSFQ